MFLMFEFARDTETEWAAEALLVWYSLFVWTTEYGVRQR